MYEVPESKKEKIIHLYEHMHVESREMGQLESICRARIETQMRWEVGWGKAGWGEP